MKTRSVLTFALPFSLHLFDSTHALAQTEHAQQQHAETLFNEARELMGNHAFAEACPKLRASYELDPATGTLLNLAFCLENQGTTAAAYQTYEAAHRRAVDEGNEERSQFAAARLRILESKLVKIVIPTPAPKAGFWAQCDGVPARSTGSDVTCVVEPGERRVVYGAPGKMSDVQQITASEPGGELVLELRHLRDAGPLRSANISGQKRLILASTPMHSGGLADGTAAAISLGIAAVGAAGTLYFGWRARSEWEERNGFCSPGCDERALAAGHRANGFAWAANIAGAVAVLSAGVGTYFVVRPRPKSTSTVFTGTLTNDQRGAMLVATFVR